MQNSRQAEMSVLGCMMMMPGETEKVYACLAATMFESEDLKYLFNCCKKLHKAGLRPDATTCISKLGENYKQIVLECAETAPSCSGLDSYITMVQDNWRERRIRSKITEMQYSCDDADGLTATLRELLDEQQRVIRNQTGHTSKSFTESTVGFLQWLNKENTNIQTGWQDIDRMTGGLSRKGVTGISARPGCGKSTFAIQLACQAAANHQVLYQSLEMPVEQIMSAIFAHVMQVDSAVFRDRKMTNEQIQKMAEISDFLSEKWHLSIDDSDCASLSDLEGNIIRLKPEVVVVDHIGLLTPDKSKQKRNEELAEITRGLKQLAMKHNIAIVELIQASRNADGKPLTMADMFGSATIEHDADMLIGITPDKDYKENLHIPTTIQVLKNRHGAIGKIDMCWDKPYHQFLEFVK